MPKMQKEEIERKRAEAAIAFLGELNGKVYHLDPERPEEAKRNQPAPDFTFSDGEGNLCGAIEVTSSAEYMQKGKNDFQFEALIDEFRSHLKKQVEAQSNLKGEYTLEVPWPCDLPMPSNQKMWQQFVERVLEALQELAYDPDGLRHLPFWFDGLQFDLYLEDRDGSSITIWHGARFGAPPEPDDLRPALDHIVESFQSSSGTKVGVIEVLKWPVVRYVDKDKLANGLKAAYLDVDHLLLIQTKIEPPHPKWKQLGDYELLKVW
jgi:hypothetical protein